jgi:hypothetical protein
MKSICTYVPLLIVYLTAGSLKAQQPDTIVVYDIASHSTDIILPITSGSTAIFAKTGSFIGSLGNTVPLSQNPPTTNLFSGSDFCDITKASGYFNLASYPARTAVALRYYRGDSLKTGCSGIMISSSVVLTAGHCVYDYTNSMFSQFDSLKISPAYNNGADQPAIPVSMAKNIYIFKTFHDQANWDDIALIELKEPIGMETGWVGISYDTNSASYLNKVFHKFSYPSVADPFNPARVYNGDTLYYNYGYITMTSPYISINSPAATGVPGQSGSSLLYTDNTDYYSVGVFNFSNGYIHYKITKEVYDQFNNILSNYATGINTVRETDRTIKIYPNPFRDTLFVEPGESKHIVFTLTNSMGQVVGQKSGSSKQKTEINTSSLEKGMYFLQGNADGRVFSVKCIKE